MDNKGSRGQSIALAVVALLAGVMIGIVGASVFNVEDTAVTQVTDEQAETTKAAADLRTSLNRYMVEHVGLSATAVKSIHDNDSDADAAREALDANVEELAAVLASVHNDQTEEDVLALWQSFADSLEEYAAAVRDNEQAAMEQAESNMDSNIDEAVTLLSETTGLPSEDLNDDLEQYLASMTQVVSSHAAGNHTESYRVQRQAVADMAELADQLSIAIVEQNPDQF